MEYSKVVFKRLGALYFKMLCGIYAWEVRLRLCIYVFPSVGVYAGGRVRRRPPTRRGALLGPLPS